MQVRFSDTQSACLSRQSLLDQKVEVSFIKKVKSKGIEVAPVQSRSILRSSKPTKSSQQSAFADTNYELTINLLKIRPEEEVLGETQTNYAFFEELSSNSKKQHNQNSSKKTMHPSDQSTDSMNPSLEQAYSVMD